MKQHLNYTRQTMQTPKCNINEMMDSGNSMVFEKNLHAQTEIHEGSDFNSENGPTQPEESKGQTFEQLQEEARKSEIEEARASIRDKSRTSMTVIADD